MARGTRQFLPCCKTYGFPLYFAGWAPVDKISALSKRQPQESEGDVEPDAEAISPPQPQSAAGSLDHLFAVLGGGGGEGRSGVPNAIIIARYDVATRSLHENPVFRTGTGDDIPYRMALHPQGDGIVCAFPKGCRWFEWDLNVANEAQTLSLKSAEQKFTQLGDIGQQLALTFNAEGSVLATGGEDGHLRVFKWPSLELILDQSDAHTDMKDLDFSIDSKFLVSVGRSGPCRVWDLTSAVSVSLPTENGEVFGFCKFSQRSDNDEILYVISKQGQYWTIVSYAHSWMRIRTKKLVRDNISAFGISSDGKFLAIGTVEGEIVILSSEMQVKTRVRDAHIGSITALVFSPNSRCLISTSWDYTARVTVIEDKGHGGPTLYAAILVVLLAILLYYMKLKRYM